MKQSLFNILSVAIFLYIGLIVLMYFSQSRLIFLQRPILSDARTLAAFSENEITIRNKDVTLRGWLLNPGQENILFYYGGNGEEVSLNIHDFQRFKDFSIVLINYRGYGDSGGEPGQAALFEDALLIFDEMIGKSATPIKNIVLFGRSLGSGIATYAAAHRKVQKVILITPYDSVEAIAKGQFPFLPVSWLLRHPFPSIEYAPRIDMPTLVLRAEFDEVIPATHTERLVAHFGENCRSVMIESTGHNTIQSNPKYWQEISQFLK